MNTLKKSKFNFIFLDDDGRYVYFNKITNRLSVFSPDQHRVYVEDSVMRPEHSDLKRELAQKGFLIPAEVNETKLLRTYYEKFIKPFEFTIELSRVCNFKCPYCYQNGTHDARKVISQEVLDACVRYASYVLTTQDVREFELNFIGGEPLLHQDKLLFVYRRVREVLERRKSIHWRLVIDTNGAQLNDKFLAECENTSVSVTLSPKEHHDRNRTFLSGRSSFDVIVRNLIENRHHFARDGNQLLIRYNLDQRNRDLMREFIRFLASLQIDNLSFMVVNVVNYDFNPDYHNELTEADFFDQCGIALDEMVKLDIPVQLIPYGVITPCHVFTPFSCKVFWDGKLNGCDISDQPGEGRIFDLPDDNIFRGRESMNALTHKLCLGDYKICNLQVFPLRQYLQIYRRAIETGKEHLFASFNDYGEKMRTAIETLFEQHCDPFEPGVRAELPILSNTSVYLN